MIGGENSRKPVFRFRLLGEKEFCKGLKLRRLAVTVTSANPPSCTVLTSAKAETGSIQPNKAEESGNFFISYSHIPCRQACPPDGRIRIFRGKKTCLRNCEPQSAISAADIITIPFSRKDYLLENFFIMQKVMG